MITADTPTPVAIIRELLQRAGYQIDTASFEEAERTLCAIDNASIVRRIETPTDFAELLAEIEGEVRESRRAIRHEHYRRYQKAARELRGMSLWFPIGSDHCRLYLALSAAAISISVRDDPLRPRGPRR